MGRTGSSRYLIGKWKIGKWSGGGYGYTADGNLYTLQYAKSAWQLMVFDRASSSWKVVEAMLPGDSAQKLRYLIGADGDDLVGQIGPPSWLAWFRPPSK